MATIDIDPRTLDRAFGSFLAEASIDLTASVDAGLRALIDFYSNVRAAGCDPLEDQDMLLFQWGTYDWGEGKRFEIDLVRQVMLPDEEDDDAIWQLHLTYRYPAPVELAAFGSGDRWCQSPSEAADFLRFVLGTPAVARAISLGGSRPEITFECCG